MRRLPRPDDVAVIDGPRVTSRAISAPEAAECRLVGECSAALALGRGAEAEVRDALAALPEAEALALGARIEALLRAEAVRTGEWAAWAEALHFLPRPRAREAAAELCARLDRRRAAEAVARDPHHDRRFRITAAFRRLVTGGLPADAALRRVLLMNRAAGVRLPAGEVRQLAAQAAASLVKEARRAAA